MEMITQAPPSSLLSVDERQRLEVYEAAIEAGFKSQEAQILAAEQVRKERLWREEYASWEEYCEKRWLKSAVRMNELIRTEHVRANLRETVNDKVVLQEGGQALPERHVVPNPKQAVELAKLPEPEQQREAWQETLTQTNGKPTAADVRAVVDQIKAAENPLAPYRFLQSAHWPPAEALEIAQALNTMGCEDCNLLVELLSEPDNDVALIRVQFRNYQRCPEEQRRKIRRLWQTGGSGDRSWVVQTLAAAIKAPIDFRRLPLDYAQKYVKEAIDLAPEDSLVPSLKEARIALLEALKIIKKQEGERNDTR